MSTSDHLSHLRRQMANQQIDAFLIPHDDRFFNESLPSHNERLGFISGFTGSAGIAVVAQEKAAIFTNSLYDLQIKIQVNADLFEIYNLANNTPHKWVAKNLPASTRLGYDPSLHSPDDAAHFLDICNQAEMTLIPVSQNPLDVIWQDIYKNRPALPPQHIHALPDHIAGQSGRQKIKAIQDHLAQGEYGDKIRGFLLFDPQSVSWLLNLRGAQVAETPSVQAHGFLHLSGDQAGQVDLFIAADDIHNAPDGAPNDAHAASLDGWVNIIAPENMRGHLEKIAQDAVKGGTAIGVDPQNLSQEFINIFSKNGAKIAHLTDPCYLPRAMKNDAEIAAIKMAHIIDGIAMTRFLHGLDQHSSAQNGKNNPDWDSEWKLARKLDRIRDDMPGHVHPSFDVISGFAQHGAIIHYRVSEESSLNITHDGLYLVDSGGQYLSPSATKFLGIDIPAFAGTTDITRTIAISGFANDSDADTANDTASDTGNDTGHITDDMKRHYTAVLKGHVAVSMVKFPYGTNGTQIDTLARQALWDLGLDYAHGTGHGVGCYLSVHEDSPSITPRGEAGMRILEPGMVISNEPGYYQENSHGIRIENVVCVAKTGEKTNDGKDILCFETLTLAPYDRRLIIIDALTSDEIDWINAYHTRVYTTLKPFFENSTHAEDKDNLKWLHDACVKL